MLMLTELRVTLLDSGQEFAIHRYSLPTHMEMTDVFLTRLISMHAFAKVSLRLTTTSSKLTYGSCLLEQHWKPRGCKPLSRLWMTSRFGCSLLECWLALLVNLIRGQTPHALALCVLYLRDF